MKYIGIKVVLATPMTHAEYTKHRGWTPPAAESKDYEGFLVETEDGPNPIHWRPRDDFYGEFKPIQEFDGEIMKYFAYKHLLPHLQEVSRPISLLAELMASLPDGDEKNAGLRKLLEAKDCFVRAKLNEGVKQ